MYIFSFVFSYSQKVSHSIPFDDMQITSTKVEIILSAESHCRQLKNVIKGIIEPLLTYSPNGRFLVQETFPKTLSRFALILISLQRWQHRVRNETKQFVSPHLIGPQFLANQHETNQHESAALIGLFHTTSSVLLSVESYRNYRKPMQRGVHGYLSSLQRRVLLTREGF